jgi:hypothetical protein
MLHVRLHMRGIRQGVSSCEPVSQRNVLGNDASKHRMDKYLVQVPGTSTCHKPKVTLPLEVWCTGKIHSAVSFEEL